MSILINGMEMPESCLECRFFNDPWCMAKNSNQWRTAYNRPPKGEKQNDCPIVPVPPHGRLIDADALISKINYTDNFYETPFVDWDDILEAPTVIPADNQGGDA